MAKTKESPAKKKRLHITILKQMLALATSGFGLVAALAWNNVIQEFVNTNIKPFFSDESGLLSLLLYALIVTVLAVFVTYQLSKILERLDG